MQCARASSCVNPEIESRKNKIELYLEVPSFQDRASAASELVNLV